MVVDPERDAHMILIKILDGVFPMIIGRETEHFILARHRSDVVLVPKKPEKNLGHRFRAVPPQFWQHFPLEYLMERGIKPVDAPPDFSGQSHPVDQAQTLSNIHSCLVRIISGMLSFCSIFIK
jgi:hypothetical protein